MERVEDIHGTGRRHPWNTVGCDNQCNHLQDMPLTINAPPPKETQTVEDFLMKSGTHCVESVGRVVERLMLYGASMAQMRSMIVSFQYCLIPVMVMDLL